MPNPNGIELRQSVIKDYLNCPLFFKYKHVQGIKPRWRHPNGIHGTILHFMLYHLHLSGWISYFREYYVSMFDYLEFKHSPECEIPVYWRQSRKVMLASYVANAEEVLTGYWQRPENRSTEIMISEQNFRVSIAGYMFSGRINQVRRNESGEIELVDFSSAKLAPNRAGLFNDLQLNLYAYALTYGEILIDKRWQTVNCQPDYLCKYHLRGHEIRKKRSPLGNAGEEKLAEPLFRVPYRAERTNEFRNELLRLIADLKQPVQYPNPNFCQFCPYTNICLKR